MLVAENTNSWNPVVDGRRGGATRRHVKVECEESNAFIGRDRPDLATVVVSSEKKKIKQKAYYNSVHLHIYCI